MSSVARFVARGSCARLAAVGLVCAAVGGCGTAAPKVAREPRPVWCPNSGERIGGGPALRAAGSFDARILLGRSLRSAQRVAARHGCEVRVANASSILTADFDTHRVDVKTKDGLVIAVRAS